MKASLPGCLQTGFLEIAELDDRGMLEPETLWPRACRMCATESASRNQVVESRYLVQSMWLAGVLQVALGL